MTLDELRPILAAYRKQVEPAWSAATAHPGYDGRAGDPAGQCGVTSAWLQRRLREDHGIKTLYVDGNVYVSTGERSGGRLVDHCWLELADGDNWLIIDLTANQNPKLDLPPVVCEHSQDLYLRGIDYVGDLYQSGRDLPNSVRVRLSALLGSFVMSETEPCGTRAAYKRHLAQREDPCAPCRAANAEYMRAYRSPESAASIRARKLASARTEALVRLSQEFPDRFQALYDERLEALS